MNDGNGVITEVAGPPSALTTESLQLVDDDGLAYFARFGVDESLIRQAFDRALCRGGDWAELYFEHRIGNHVGLEDGAVNRAYSSVSLGVGIRVIQGDQTGYAYTEDLSLKSVMAAAGTAAVVADGVARLGPKQLKPQKRPDRYTITRNWSDIGIASKMPILQRVNERAFQRDSRIVKVRVGFADSSGAVLVVDSDGKMSFDRQPMTRISVGCTADHDGQRESNGYNMAGRSGMSFYSDERVDGLTDEAVRRTTFLFDAVPAPAGSLPIVLAAGSSGILLHEAIGHGMEPILIVRISRSIARSSISKSPPVKSPSSMMAPNTVLGVPSISTMKAITGKGQRSSRMRTEDLYA